MATYYFGEVPGNPIGTAYADRAAAKDAGVHQVTQQGISGNRTVGANSIVVNGGYEDDFDLGDEIIYTGAGGNDPNTKKQIADQTFEQIGNAGLVVSEEHGLPVRVIRGSRGDRSYSPTSGLRYDGLYRVESHWYETGKSGFKICRFRLLKLNPLEADDYGPGATKAIPSTGHTSTTQWPPPPGEAKPDREAGLVLRVVRDTAVANWVKTLYGHACQVCDTVMDLPVGNYSEGAHIRPLGKPHDGPDVVANVLCLCPTHHVLFDKGAIYIDSQWRVRDYHETVIGLLRRHPRHRIDHDQVAYHRGLVGK